MKKWKVKMIYQEVMEKEVEAEDEAAAIVAAVNQDGDGVQVDYFLHDAEAFAA